MKHLNTKMVDHKMSGPTAPQRPENKKQSPFISIRCLLASTYFLKLTAYSLLTIFLSACENELNQVPISDASTATFYQSTGDFEKAVTGVYSSLRLYPDRLLNLSETRSDNIYGVGEAGVRDFEPVNNFASTLATNPLILEAWNANFEGIFRANTLLDQLKTNGGVVTDATLRNRFEGEAKFLRAFYYFDLVRWFGKVPVITQALIPSKILEIPRSPIEDVYALIIADLQDAIQKLPESYPVANKGRVTSFAAKAILGLVYLSRSGPIYGIEGPGLAKNEYSQALELFNEVINSKKYALVTPYPNIFSYTNENNSEVIFDIQYQSGGLGIGATFPGVLTPDGYLSAVKVPFPGGGEIRPVSDDLMKSYGTGDVRLDFNVQKGFKNVNGTLETRPFIRKYLNEILRGQDRFDWPINFIVLRYTDVLMMKAECILNISGSTSEVDDIVNSIRKRAGFTTPLVGVTLGQLMEERRKEFAGEGLRWFDLIREGLVLQVMNVWIPNEDGAKKNQMRKNIDATQILYPIPQSQLDVKKGLYDQNPGY